MLLPPDSHLQSTNRHRFNPESGSTLVIVLWIAIGLVSLTLYFAQSMLFELRASDHRVESISADQAIEAGARYAVSVLSNLQTNGAVPVAGTYSAESVPLSTPTAQPDSFEAPRFWFIGRDTNATPSTRVAFGLIDEGSKLNLNSARSNSLYYLSDMNLELTEAILDWRNTNGPGTTLSWYGMQSPAYECKQAPFETTDEIRLLMGAEPTLIQGEDRNRNGVLDPDEVDENRDGVAEPSLLDCLTVYSREPNTYSNGIARVNVRVLSPADTNLRELLMNNLSSGRAEEVLRQLGIGQGGGPPASFPSPLAFYRRSGMTLEEFEAIADKVTVAQGDYIEGRVNINTASTKVLSCLPGLTDSPDLVDTLANYRLTNPDRTSSIAWIVEALGSNNSTVLDELQRQDILTTRSYQFTADVAATGAYGRGYKRAKFVIDTVTSVPRIIYRQDLTALGWALGKETRELISTQNNQNGPLASN